MSWVLEQTEAARELAEAMKKKRIEWNYEMWEHAISKSGKPFVSIDEGKQPTFMDEEGSFFNWVNSFVPLPTFERCLELLEERGWNEFHLDVYPQDIITLASGGANLRCVALYRIANEPIETTGPDSTTCAILACVEAVRRMK